MRTDSSFFVFDALIRKFSPEKKERFAHFLQDPSFFSQASFSNHEFDTKDFSIYTYLRQIHYSWWIEPLKSFGYDGPVFLSLFPEKQIHRLEKILGYQASDQTISKMQTQYLEKVLFDQLSPPIPAAYLPHSLMRILLQLSKKELVFLIDLLSLYDLSHEMKKIVDTKVLKPIYQCLNSAETSFLKKISQTIDSFSIVKIDLYQWDKQEITLRKHLHKAGIYRLAIAMQTEHPDLVWHIAHRLDIGRGSFLLKITEKKAPISVVSSIQASIIQLVEEEHL